MVVGRGWTAVVVIVVAIHAHRAVVTSVAVGVVMVVVVHGAGGNAVVIHRSQQVSSPSCLQGLWEYAGLRDCNSGGIAESTHWPCESSLVS